ncbi:hypothetical protein [Aliiroseovarius sp. YM-037]|uniref:hypothetical protein n=1 Tax=Aliiroseovarius sp. YM-037 TaxID=3341728 RepID=UPI003A810B26
MFAPKQPPVAVQNGSDAARPAPRPGGIAAPANARTVEDFDTTSAGERAAAQAVSAGGEALGTTIASLGAPAEPGFWLETPLVDVVTQGRVVYEATGASATVELRPIDGPATAGSRLSLAAMRLIGAPLTGLPELTVYTN